MTIAREIRAEMARNDTTVSTLAQAIGMCRNTMTSRLQGHSDFRVNELERIGNVLGVPGWEFIRRAHTTQSTTI